MKHLNEEEHSRVYVVSVIGFSLMFGIFVFTTSGNISYGLIGALCTALGGFVLK